MNGDELQAYLARLESDVADLGFAVQELRGELADAVAGGSVKAAEPSFADLEEWVSAYVAVVFARNVTNTTRWCARWHDHLEVVERFRAAFVAHREAQQSGRVLSWLQSFDQQLSVITGPDGPLAACTPRDHRPPDPLPVEETP